MIETSSIELLLGPTVNFAERAPVPKGLSWQAEDQSVLRVCTGDMSMTEVVCRMFLVYAGTDASGENFKDILASKPVLGDNLLEALLANCKYIPEKWKGHRVFFLGCKYRHSNGEIVVRCLCWREGRWSEDIAELSDIGIVGDAAVIMPV